MAATFRSMAYLVTVFGGDVVTREPRAKLFNNDHPRLEPISYVNYDDVINKSQENINFLERSEPEGSEGSEAAVHPVASPSQELTNDNDRRASVDSSDGVLTPVANPSKVELKEEINEDMKQQLLREKKKKSRMQLKNSRAAIERKQQLAKKKEAEEEALDIKSIVIESKKDEVDDLFKLMEPKEIKFTKSQLAAQQENATNSTKFAFSVGDDEGDAWGTDDVNVDDIE